MFAASTYNTNPEEAIFGSMIIAITIQISL
jgi:hypothetical protein